MTNEIQPAYFTTDGLDAANKKSKTLFENANVPCIDFELIKYKLFYTFVMMGLMYTRF